MSTLDIDIRKQLGAFTLAAKVQLPSQGVTAVYGASGSGKTTLINAIAGLISPDEGHIQIGAIPFFDSRLGINLATHRRRIGCVFQHSRLFPHLSVRSNLLYGSKDDDANGTPIALDTVASVLGIESLLHRRPQALSGGERQRVALGRALLSQPQLLLMDEPLAALDSARKAEILSYIERLRDQFRIPILYVTHALSEVVRLADHVVILDAGKNVCSGPLLDVMSDPAAAPWMETAQAGSVIVCKVAQHDAHYHLSRLSFDGGTLSVPRLTMPPGTSVRVRLPARDVAIATAPLEHVSISNQLEGQITRIVRDAGSTVEVVVAVGSVSLRAVITRHSCDRLVLAEGMKVWALIKSVALDRHAISGPD